MSISELVSILLQLLLTTLTLDAAELVMPSLRVSGDPIESAEKRIDITLRLWGGLAAKDLNGYERLIILKYN